MKQPVLVVMAAGMGSRYGGLKQLDTVGPHGQIIIDYSLYDAYRAGFRHVIFIIRPELRYDFEHTVGARARARFTVDYAYQTVDNVPQGCAAPAGRTKPLGTGHAIWCAACAIDGAPFAAINADDFYGAHAFRVIYERLALLGEDELHHYCMVGYPIENTLSESGTVSRGICRVTDDGSLSKITERTTIAREADGVIRCEGDALPDGTIVSLNLWGFTPAFLSKLTDILRDFLTCGIAENPLKMELYLPGTVDLRLRSGEARVDVLPTKARWFGVTYREDKPVIERALQAMTDAGDYPAEF